MNVVSFPQISPPAQPWGDLALLYRRICTLRAVNKAEEADQLQAGEFSRVLASIQDQVTDGQSPGVDARLQTLFTAEEERVANASVLASLLAPLVAELLPSPAPLNQIAAAAATKIKIESPLPANSPSRVTSRAADVTPTLSVADFIEGMLTQQRAETRGHA